MTRDVLFVFHLKFWIIARNGIPVQSLLQGSQTSNWSITAKQKDQMLDGIKIKHLFQLPAIK